MRRYFFLSTLLAASILFADEKNPFPSAPLLSSLDSEPSCVIDGCVNVILGSFFDYEEDLAIQGPEKLSVERLLINNNPNSMSDAFLQAPEWVFGDCQHLSRGCESYHCSYYGGLGELAISSADLFSAEVDALIYGAVSLSAFVDLAADGSLSESGDSTETDVIFHLGYIDAHWRLEALGRE